LRRKLEPKRRGHRRPMEVDAMVRSIVRTCWIGAAIAASLLCLPTSNSWARTQLLDGTWSGLTDGDGAPGPRREYAAIYDAANQRYLLFAGFNGDTQGTYILFNEVWTLSLDPLGTPTWTHLDIPGSGPGARHSPQWGYDAARNRLLVFGGYGSHY